jgi:hypothetical protein
MKVPPTKRGQIYEALQEKENLSYYIDRHEKLAGQGWGNGLHPTHLPQDGRARGFRQDQMILWSPVFVEIRYPIFHPLARPIEPTRSRLACHVRNEHFEGQRHSGVATERDYKKVKEVGFNGVWGHSTPPSPVTQHAPRGPGDETP